MNLFLLKRLSLPLLLTLAFLSFGCSKKVATPPPPPPAAPPAPAPPAPGVTLSADRTTITAGQAVTLSYTSTNAAAVSIAPGVGPVTPPANGTRVVSPTATTTYTAAATGPGGSANSPGVVITVAAAAAPPPPPPVADKPAPQPTDRRTLEQIFTQTMVPILFDYDKSNIRASEESKLLSIAAWLKQTPAVRFTIEGHADERGSQEYNIALGDERAASVKKYLAGQGVAENRMNTVSYGEERPICRDQNEDCFQKNRRAAFVKIP